MERRPTPQKNNKTFLAIRNKFTFRKLRRIVQLTVAGFILFLMIQHIVVGESSTASTASPEAYCPFGGLETLYQFITGGNSFISHAHLSNIVMLIAVLVVALLFRSAFCGWICPLGFFQDIMHLFSKFLQKRIPGLRHWIVSLGNHSRVLHVLDRYLRFVKYLVLIWAIGGASYFGVMVFRDYDPWAAFLNLLEFSFTPGLIVLIVTLLASFFIERPWCRYACPLGAVSGLVGKLSPAYIKRNPEVCTSCKLCTRSCPMGLKVHSVDTIKSVDCVSCLECVGTCPQKGALEVKVGIPLIGK